MIGNGGKFMIAPKMLPMQMQLKKGSRELIFTAEYLVCAGNVGRDQKAVQAHIDELAKLGVPGPTQIPTFMNYSAYLLNTDDEITVVSGQSSGEVECVLLCQGKEMWVTVGSDHTDREQESKSIPASKQMCAKPLAGACWPYADVQDHWDRLIMRCWVRKGEERALYQEAPLGLMLGPRELLEKMPRTHMDPQKGFVLFCGTVATKGGLIYGDSYDLEMEDPVLKRKIQTHYKVKILPQYL
jgi:hypothetical protein